MPTARPSIVRQGRGGRAEVDEAGQRGDRRDADPDARRARSAAACPAATSEPKVMSRTTAATTTPISSAMEPVSPGQRVTADRDRQPGVLRARARPRGRLVRLGQLHGGVGVGDRGVADAAVRGQRAGGERVGHRRDIVGVEHLQRLVTAALRLSVRVSPAGARTPRGRSRRRARPAGSAR